MTRQIIRSRTHRVLAHIAIDHHGVHTISDAKQKILGRFDPRTNRTFDRVGRIVGRGYLLPALIQDDLHEEDLAVVEEEESGKPPTAVQVSAKNKRRLAIQQQVRTEQGRSSSRLRDLQTKLRDL